MICGRPTYIRLRSGHSISKNNLELVKFVLYRKFCKLDYFEGMEIYKKKLNYE